MHAHRLTAEYDNGVKEFIKFAVEYADNSNYIWCPCVRCDCIDKLMVDKLRDHLFIYEIDKSWHGASARGDRPIISNDERCDKREKVHCSECDQLEYMIHDVEKILRIAHTYSRA